jgi:hypothetical protein
LAFGNDAFESSVFQWMVFRHHRRALDRRIQRRAFGNAPGEQNTFLFQAEIVVQMTGLMLLDYEREFRGRSARLGSSLPAPALV